MMNYFLPLLRHVFTSVMNAHVSYLIFKKGFCLEAHGAWWIIKHGVEEKDIFRPENSEN